MHTELYSISRIFTEALFRIPDYQRGYAWGERQLKDFWADITQLGSDEDHYTGVLTFEEVPHTAYEKWVDDLWIIESKKYIPYYVVDGQQRLTTVVILIQALIETLPSGTKVNYTDAGKIKEKFIFESKDEGISRSYLFGYEKDNPSYEFLKTKIYLEQSSNHSSNEETIYTHNLLSAKKFFLKNLEGLELKAIESLYTKLTQHLLFNIYTISQKIDVFVAFETMNNRGKPLSHLELLKNRLIFLSTKIPSLKSHDRDKLRRTINESWKTVYHVLGRNRDRPLHDDMFLWVHYQNFFSEDLKKISEDHQKPSWRWRDFQYFKNFLLDDVFNIKNLASTTPVSPDFRVTSAYINTYALDLKSGVEKFFYVNNADLKDNPNEETLWLSRLHRLDSFDSAPLVYNVISEVTNYDIRISILKNADFLLFSRTLWRRQVLNEVDLQQTALDLASKKLSAADVAQFLENLSEKVKIEIQTAPTIDLARNTGHYGWQAVKYFLYEYELHLRANAKAAREKIDWSEYIREHFGSDYSSVEHIYPQTATAEEWRKDFNKYSVKERNQLRHSIGNLLPLSKPKNSSLRNKPFSEKKASLKDSTGYAYGGYCENEVAQCPRWTAVEILNRGIKLLKFMEMRWNLDLGNDQSKINQLGLSFVVTKEKL